MSAARAGRAGSAARRGAGAAIQIDVATVGVRVPLSRVRVAEIARSVLLGERVREFQLSIAFVDERTMATLNWKHLRHRGPTDIISFELPATPGMPRSGDVYISPDVARRNARAHGVGVREELARLVIHGALHVLGWEHPEDEGRDRSPMWRRQERLLARLHPTAARAGRPPRGSGA